MATEEQIANARTLVDYLKHFLKGVQIEADKILPDQEDNQNTPVPIDKVNTAFYGTCIKSITTRILNYTTYNGISFKGYMSYKLHFDPFSDSEMISNLVYLGGESFFTDYEEGIVPFYNQVVADFNEYFKYSSKLKTALLDGEFYFPYNGGSFQRDLRIRKNGIDYSSVTDTHGEGKTGYFNVDTHEFHIRPWNTTWTESTSYYGLPTITVDYHGGPELYIDDDPDYHILTSQEPAVIVSNDEVVDMTVRNYYTTQNIDNGTYITQGGDTINYYSTDDHVYINPNDTTEVTYDDLKQILDDVADKINIRVDLDEGDKIVIPTYHETKYGPDPDPTLDDDYTDMGLGLPSLKTSGLTRFAILTLSDLVQLVNDFNQFSVANQKLTDHIIGLYRLGVASSVLLTTNSDKIVFLMETGVSDFTTTDNYNLLDETEAVIPLGSIEVNRKALLTNTFYDYSPYTTYEMFIPCCGWVTLPDTIVGRTISVYLLFDIATCSCKGIVRIGSGLLGGYGTTIATINGIIGSSVPFTINENGLQKGAIMSGGMQTVAGLSYAGVGVAIGSPGLGVSGVTHAAQSLGEMYMAGNSSYTSVKGGASDYSIFGDGYEAVLKINRPVVDVPDNYGHTIGYVCNKTDILGNFHGFTVCLNPHVTNISCTSTEKEEIARLLERGVILPDAEE